MSDSLEYIEAYFEQELDEAGRLQFEQRCEQDNEFARDVALYITTREAIKQALTEQKRELWRPLNDEKGTAPQMVSGETFTGAPVSNTGQATRQLAPVKKFAIRRWLPYAVAASLLFFIATLFFNGDRDLKKQIASNIQEELSFTSPSMGTSDTLEQGKTAYRNKQYDQALQLFTAVLSTDKTQDEALLFKGRIFLLKKNYDSALHYFNTLSGMQLYSNSGTYDAALTLLDRNQKGDRGKAKTLLQKVVADTLAGDQQAQGLLELMK